MAWLSNLSIVEESTGKRILIKEIDNSVTAKELLDALTSKINKPIGTNAVLIRKTTRKQLLPQQTLAEVGIESGETLIADFERTAGGHLEFYPLDF